MSRAARLHYAGQTDFIVAARDKQVTELHQSGCSLREIGDAIGISHTQCRRILKRLGTLNSIPAVSIEQMEMHA